MRHRSFKAFSLSTSCSYNTGMLAALTHCGLKIFFEWKHCHVNFNEDDEVSSWIHCELWGVKFVEHKTTGVNFSTDGQQLRTVTLVLHNQPLMELDWLNSGKNLRRIHSQHHAHCQSVCADYLNGRIPISFRWNNGHSNHNRSMYTS